MYGTKLTLDDRAAHWTKESAGQPEQSTDPCNQKHQLASKRKIPHVQSVYVPPHRRNKDESEIIGKPINSQANLSKSDDIKYNMNRNETVFNNTGAMIENVSNISPRTKYEPPNSPDYLLQLNDNLENKLVVTKESSNSSGNLLQLNNDVKNEQIPSVNDSHVILQRILNLANVFVNEEFKSQLITLYEKMYNTELTIDYLKTLKLCVNFTKDETIHVHDNNDKGEDTLTAPTQTVLLKKKIEPGVLALETLPKEMWVNIYTCKNVIEIWGIITDEKHLGEVEEMADSMNLFYQSKHPITAVIEEGKYYAVLDGSWHRVQCLKCTGTSANVVFIDRGDDDIFPIEKMSVLDEKFCELPAQAMRMSMSGLETFSECNELQAILQEILFEKTVYAKVENVKNDEYCLEVQLYLNVDNDKVININDFIVHELFQTTLNPILYTQKNEILKANVTVIKDQIIVQLNTKSLEYFEKLMETITHEYLQDESLLKRQTIVRFSDKKLYMVKDSVKNQWFRGRILGWKNENEYEVYLIDFGKTLEVHRKNFILLENLSSILANYPEQAIAVELYQLSRDRRVLSYFHRFIGDDALYVKFITTPKNKLPEVQFFKKTQSDELACINDALLVFCKPPKTDGCQQSITRSIEQSHHKISKINKDTDSVLPELSLKINKENVSVYERRKSPVDQLEVKPLQVNDSKRLFLSSELNPPDLPKDYFDVHVIIAENPSRFVVQMLRNKCLDLKKLGEEMSKIGHSYKNSKLLTHKSLQVGKLYAYRCQVNDDERWYRVYLTKIIDEKFVTVYCCDYGNIRKVLIDDLIPLDKQFSKLPYQAIWAELHGVKPKADTWSEKDQVRFADLTYSRNFVCSVKNKRDVRYEKSNTLPIFVETIYSLKLIDTSSDKDINIARILVKEGRAIKTV